MTGGVLAVLLPWIIAAFALALTMNLWRLWRGPSAADRILALDTLYINALALVVVYGMHVRSSTYLEAALLIAMLGFVGTVALCKFVLRGDIVQ